MEMKTQVNGLTTKIWLSANDTYNWAHKIGASWPCSTLSNRQVFAEFDGGDLIDIAIDGKSDDNVDACEFNAIITDLTEIVL